jgi:hypothetical protein
MPKQKPVRKRHPHVQKAIDHISDLEKTHRKLQMDLQRVRKRLTAIPFIGIPHKA